jgi:hypothetical protein
VVPVLVAALLVSASSLDAVYTADGSRLAGTVQEESASGITIQLPDGSVRRIDRSQVVRIEFADGTVSTPRAAPPPPPPRAPAAPGLDTVYLRGGGRARGTVMDESATTGVKLRLLDGANRFYRPEEIARIEYADGSVSIPGAHRGAEPVPVRAKVGEGPLDTAYFVGGGRVRGTVIEENPKAGVRVRLIDGTIHTYAYDELQRIEYADGSVSDRSPPAPAAAPDAAAPEQRPQAFPVYLTLGVGVTFLGGDASRNVRMSEVIDTTQGHLSTELGFRLTPAFALGAYADIGGGEAASSIREQCKLEGNDCVGTTGRAGFLVRYAWAPLSRRTPWLSLGTGWERVEVSREHHPANAPRELVAYTGREYLRVGAGIDFRTSRVLGFGLYGSVAFGEYSRREDPVTTVSVDRATHTTGQLGIRLVLFP